MCSNILSLWPQRSEWRGGELARLRCKQIVEGLLFHCFLLFDWCVCVGGALKSAGCLCPLVGQPEYCKVAEQRAQAGRGLRLHP